MALNEGMMSRMQRNNFKTLASISRINLLRELQVRGPLTIEELSHATNLHHNTAREHMHRLISAGLVSYETIYKNAKGRPKIQYRTATGAEHPSSGKRLLASQERTRKLNAFVTNGKSNPTPTASQRQLEVLEDHMDQCGFEAEINPDGTKMVVHDCPFGDLAKENPQVCQVHYALVKDSLELGGGPVQAVGLNRFESPNTCSIDISLSESSEQEDLAPQTVSR
ncbi:MAG: helix-turn-helix domain-containing protein [Microbacteriaceae bacterium]|nr:helix-turn-helix domain-containing protein [Microbacteriaceae bacterium]